MAIIVPDRKDVDLTHNSRGSKIQPVETYTRPVVPDMGANDGLAQALANLGSALGSLGEQQQAKQLDFEKKNAELYVNQVEQGLKGGAWDESVVNNVLSPLHSTTRALVTQMYGVRQGARDAAALAESMPPEAMLTPEGQKAWIMQQKAEAMKRAGNIPFYSAGYLAGLNGELDKFEGTNNRIRQQKYNDTILDGFRTQMSTGTQGSYTPKYAPKPDQAKAIVGAAQELGVDPVDLATVISYETGGTFNPWQKGPTTKWGTHRGWIQWGEPQAKKYGVSKDSTPEQQAAAVVQYLRDAGFKKGMGLLEMYAAINAGHVSKVNASDVAAGGDRRAPRVVDKVALMKREHYNNAVRFLGLSKEFQTAETKPADQKPVQVASLDPSAGVARTVDNPGTQPVASNEPPMQAAQRSQTPAVLPQTFGTPDAQLPPQEAPWGVKVLLDQFFDNDRQVKAAAPWLKGEAKAIAIQTFLNEAIEKGDVRYLHAFPQHLLNADDKKSFIAAAKHIDDRIWQISERMETLKKRAAAEKQDQMQQNIVKKILEGNEVSDQDAVDPQTGRVDVEMLKFMDEQRDKNYRISQRDSDGNAALLSDAIERAALTDNWVQLDPRFKDRAPTDRELNFYIRNNPNIRPKEAEELIKKLPQLRDTITLVQSPVAKAHFEAYLGSDIKAIQANPINVGLKINSVNLMGDVKKVFDTELRRRIKSYVEDTGQQPKGSKFDEILDQAEAKAKERLQTLVQPLGGTPPQAPQAPRANTPATPAKPPTQGSSPIMRINPDGTRTPIGSPQTSKPLTNLNNPQAQELINRGMEAIGNIIAP